MQNIVNFKYTRELIDWLSRNRFVILFAFIFYKSAIHATNGLWLGDFWEHSAVVRALSLDLINPTHPFFHSNASHAFFSPYSIWVATIARVLSINSVNALALSGLINLCLLFFGVYNYANSLSLNTDIKQSKTVKSSHAHITAFYVILCMMFLWGTNPWGYSGFYYFDLIVFVLPYPSTFSAALSLIALSINTKRLLNNQNTLLINLFVISVIVLLSHPLTFIFLATGLIAQSLCLSERLIKNIIFHLIITCVFLSLVALVAMLWPYYSIYEMSQSAGNVFHASNKPTYFEIINKAWPIIVSLPLICWSLNKRSGQSALIMIAGLIIVYLYGFISTKYSYGRVIAYIALVLQFLISEGIARLEIKVLEKIEFLKFIIPVVLISLLLYLSSSWLYETTYRAMTVARSILIDRPISNQQSYKDLLFLKKFVDDNDLILADIKTSWLIPTISGKVIAAQHPQAFIEDYESRVKDLNSFFMESTTQSQRMAFLIKYKPDYLLLDKKNKQISEYIKTGMLNNNIGTLIYDDQHYYLLRLFI